MGDSSAWWQETVWISDDGSHAVRPELEYDDTEKGDIPGMFWRVWFPEGGRLYGNGYPEDYWDRRDDKVTEEDRGSHP